MVVVLIVLLIFLLLFSFYAWTTIGRMKNPGFQELSKWAYAHRGLHGQGVPENSMMAFRRAKEAGYGVELDVHLLRDGNLAVIHDAALLRTTGEQGYIEDLTTEQLQEYHLEGTEETIPQFQEVLDLFAGEAPLIVELKAVNNYVALCQKVCEVLDAYTGAYCLESFDPRCIRWLRKNRPDLIRGQLTEDYFKYKNANLPWILKFTLKHQMINFLTRPDFVAYRFSDRKTLSNFLCRKVWGVQGVAWTICNPHEFEIAKEEKWIPIFEGFRP